MRRSIALVRCRARAARFSALTFNREVQHCVSTAARSSWRRCYISGSLLGYDARDVQQRAFNSSTENANTVSMGSRVTLTYKAALENGVVFDDGSEPVTFVCGEGAMVAGFHKGILGMRVGETRELTVQPSDGFGEWDQKAVAQAPVGQLPAGCKVGTQLSLGQGREATVVAIDEEVAILDMNHPLAGKTVIFNVSLLSCEEVPENERLIVETITPGDGVTYPRAGDKVTVHYTGSLASSGEVFESSRVLGEPMTFTVGIEQVIQGWDEGVLRMSLGERAMFKVPSSKGYRAEGIPQMIPPNADLVFEMELLGVE